MSLHSNMRYTTNLAYPTTKSVFIGYIYSEKGSGSALKTPPDTPKNP